MSRSGPKEGEWTSGDDMRGMREEAKRLLSEAKGLGGPITDKDLAGLPGPVQKYLRLVNVVGKAPVHTVRLRQVGRFRTGPDKRWFPAEAEQYFTTDPPAFLWYGRIRPAPLLSVTGKDALIGGKGRLVIKALSLIKIVDSRGPETDQSEMVRYLTETIWFPTSWLSPHIRWEEVDERTARATLNYGGTAVSADFHFEGGGLLTHLTADRYYEQGGGYSIQRWVIPVSDYRDLGGLRIPVRFKVTWELGSGAFSYFEGEVTGIDYNAAEPY